LNNDDAIDEPQRAMSDKRPLKILYISNHRRFKINFRARPWAREMAARGHDVDVMCHADTERWRTRIGTVDGFRLIENPDLLVGQLRQGWDPVCAWRRGRFLFREGKPYDIIHCLDTRLAVIWPALAYARRKNITIVSDWIDWWGRGGLIAERRPGWYRLLFSGLETFFEEHYRNKLDGLTAISDALIERAVTLGVPRERCLKIPGGANLRAFEGLPGKAAAKAALGLGANAPVLCFSGLDVLIDLPLAVHTYEKVREKRPEVRLLLVGPTERNALAALQDRANRVNIKALGPVPYEDLGKCLAAADVFLMPYAGKISNRGRWPNKVGDYMCVGRPIVSNPVGEVQWLFENFNVGVIAPPEAGAMAEATLALLDDPVCAGALGQQARQTAEQHFTWDTLTEPLEAWYYALLASRRP